MMTQYDRLMSGKATSEDIANEIKASAERVNGTVYKRLPGHVLVEEFLVPYYPAQLSDLAQRAKIPAHKLHKLIRGLERIDDIMAQRLGDFFGNGASFWQDLQRRFERGETL